MERRALPCLSPTLLDEDDGGSAMLGDDDDWGVADVMGGGGPEFWLRLLALLQLGKLL